MLIGFIKSFSLQNKAIDEVKAGIAKIWSCPEESIEKAYKIASSQNL